MEINEKNLNKVLKEQREEYQRYLGVLAEDFGSQVGLVVEQYDGIKNDIVDIKTDIMGIKQTLDSHTEMIGSIATDVEIIKSDAEFIKNSLKKKVDVDEFAFLEKRVALLEKKFQKI